MKNNYFLRHWRGELSLGKSFWLNYIIANYLYFLSARALTVHFHFLKWPLIVILLWVVFSVIFRVWQLVGAWRSSRNYSIKNELEWWGGVTRFFIIILVPWFMYALYTLIVDIKHSYF